MASQGKRFNQILKHKQVITQQTVGERTFDPGKGHTEHTNIGKYEKFHEGVRELCVSDS